MNLKALNPNPRNTKRTALKQARAFKPVCSTALQSAAVEEVLSKRKSGSRQYASHPASQGAVEKDVQGDSAIQQAWDFQLVYSVSSRFESGET